MRVLPVGRMMILVQALLALAFVIYILAGDGVRFPLAAGRETIELAFDDADGLSKADHHRVTIAGVTVGEITDVRYRDGRAVAVAEVDAGTRARLREDARALIVPRSALDDLMVELVPGRSQQPLADDATVPPDRAATPVDLDRVLETLDVDTRAQVQVLFGELATALRGRSTPLRSALGRLARATSSSGRVAAALAERRRLLASLVGELDVVFGTLADRGDSLAELVAAGRGTLEATASREAALSDTLRELPGTLQATRSALGEVRRLASPLVPALGALRPFAQRLPAAAGSLQAFLPTADAFLDDLGALARDGREPADDLRASLVALAPAARGLTPVLDKLEPVLRDIDRNRDGIGLLGERFSGVFSTQDANGPILRGLGFFEEFRPEQLGYSSDLRGPELARAKRRAVEALTLVCLDGNEAACLARYLVPGLPGAVRTAKGGEG